MINLKFIFTVLVSLITITLIYVSHDIGKPSYLWILAVITTCLTLGIIVFDRISENKDDVNSKKIIAPLIRGIVEFNSMWYDMIATDAMKPEAELEKISKNELSEILKKIDPQGNSPVVAVNEGNRQYKWTEFLLQMCLQTNIKIDEIFPHSSKIDLELIKKLSEIKNALLFKQMLIHSNMEVGNKNLNYDLDVILDYFQKVNSIDLYYQQNFKKYDGGSLQNAWTPYMGK